MPLRTTVAAARSRCARLAGPLVADSSRTRYRGRARVHVGLVVQSRACPFAAGATWRGRGRYLQV